MRVLVVADDLFFRSKIEATLGALGFSPHGVATAEQLLQAFAEENYRMAVVDLNGSMIDSLQSIRRIRQKMPAVTILGFCSHIQKELEQQAYAAGCTQVLPRSQLVQALPALLEGSSHKA